MPPKRKRGGAETKAQLLARYIRTADSLHAELQDAAEEYDNLPPHLQGSQYERNLIHATEILQRELLRLEAVIARLRS